MLLKLFNSTDNEESKRITDLWCNDTMRNACKDLKIVSITIDAERFHYMYNYYSNLIYKL